MQNNITEFLTSHKLGQLEFAGMQSQEKAGCVIFLVTLAGFFLRTLACMI